MNTVALPISNPVAKEWLLKRRENIRPWSQFLDFKMFHVPSSFPKCTGRVVRNIEYFQSNYIIVFIGLIVYCILTSPLLLIAIAALLGSCYLIKIRNDTKEIAIFGQKLTVAHQYAVVSIFAFPLFYIAGAGQVVFWILGASFFLIMLHATLYDFEKNSEDALKLLVETKASQSEIRKAYRKLSTLYHPDKNKQADAEDTFRRIAAVADVLRNDERRKTYDLILKTGLPDWRVPIYYYRRVRNMGLLEMTIFLFCLATLAQYLFAWSAYWEKKYEIEEVVLSKIRRKAKNQRKGKGVKLDEEATVSEVMSILQKPRCQDLFPVRLFYFFVHLIKSAPSYIASCRSYFAHRKPDPIDDDEEEESQEVRTRCRKQVKPKAPDYSNILSYDNSGVEALNEQIKTEVIKTETKKKWSLDTLTEQEVLEFKKALKKFPNGTLQRWEKVAVYLDCSVPEVVTMIKQLKNQQFSTHIPLSLQGVTGTEKENFGFELFEEKGASHNGIGNHSVKSKAELVDTKEMDKTSAQNGITKIGSITKPEKIWKQEEQQTFELALQKFPKETIARWDKIAEFVATKTKEECMERYKILAQQVKKKKVKSV